MVTKSIWLGQRLFMAEIAPAKTCFFINTKEETDYEEPLRVDELIGLQRLFIRDVRTYSYCLTLGRLRLSYCKLNSREIDRRVRAALKND